MKKHDINEVVFKYRKNIQKKHENILYHLLSLGLEFVITISLATIIGFFVDKYLYTKPTFLILFSLIGFLSGLKKIFKKI
jgi:F0F1-type ATP synthase assembly protein I